MKYNWETPQAFFDTLNNEFHFTLDAAAEKDTAKCRFYYTEKALELNWANIHKSIWLNPPYDRTLGGWMQKAYESAQNGAIVVCLIQGRSSDTKWWHDYVMRASEIRYIKNRLHFGQDGKFSRANISSIVVVFRPYCTGPPTVRSIDTKGNNLDL